MSQPTWISHGEGVGNTHKGGVRLPLSGSAPGWVTPKIFPLMVRIRKLQEAAAWPGDVGRPKTSKGPQSPLLQGVRVLDDRGRGALANGQQWLPFPTPWHEDTPDLRQRTLWTLWGGEWWLGVAFPRARPWGKRGGQGGTMELWGGCAEGASGMESWRRAKESQNGNAQGRG